MPALSEVIGNLDTDIVRVVRAPRAATTEATDVVILDPAEPHAIRPGVIVLAVGVSRRENETIALVERAGREGVAAVVLRLDGDVSPPVVATAETHGLGLLTVPPEMAWGQLYSLLKTALVTGGEADASGVAVGDLFALADAVAAAVGGPVTIEDPQWRVLAFSNLGHEVDEIRRQVILGRGVPSEWRQRLEEADVARSLRSGSGVVRFDGGGDPSFARRIAAPVRAGDELLGSIWVAEAGVPFGEEAEAALLRAAARAAIHLIGHRASEDIRRRARGAFVREILEGRVPRSGPATGWPLRARGPFTAIAFTPRSGERRAGRLVAERVLGVITLYCEDAHDDAMCALVDECFWALVPTPQRDARERAVALARRIVERVEAALGVELAAGVGTAVPEVAEVPRSRRAAEQALKVISERVSAGPVAHIEDVRAHAVLFELLHLAESHPALGQGKVEALVAHDRAHGTAHVETLRAYLDCWGDAARAARRLGVHPNTLRYRVRKLAELSGLDLDDADERFVTELQVRLHAHAAPLA